MQNNQLLISPPLGRAANGGPEHEDAAGVLVEFVESAPIMIPNELKRSPKLLFDRFYVLTFPYCDGQPLDLSTC